MQVKSDRSQDRPLLTIAIPTCNRSAFLRQLLDSLRDQIAREERVSLLISDNASTDDTESAVQEEFRRGTPLDYIRNASNVGPDANFLQCYERSIGKYVWIISDDDVLLPGTIGKVLGYLAEDEYELVFVAPQAFTGDPRSIKAVPSGKRPMKYLDPAKFLRRVNIFTTLISGNIINKDRVEAIGHKPFSMLVDSCLIQLSWTFTALRAHRKSLFIREKLLCYRHGNTGGYGVARVFGPTLARITEEWLAIPRLNEIVINASLQRLLPMFLLASSRKAYGAFLDEDSHALLSRVFRHKFRYWFFDYPILVLPVSLARLWLLMLRAFNRIDRAFGCPSLSW